MPDDLERMMRRADNETIAWADTVRAPDLPDAAITAAAFSKCKNCGVVTATGPKCAKCDCYDTPTCRHTSADGDHA